MNYSEIAIAAILMVAILGVSVILLRRRGQEVKNGPTAQKPQSESFQMRPQDMPREKAPIRWTWLRIFAVIVLFFIILNAAFLHLGILGAEYYYMQAQIIAFEMQRSTFLPMWGLELITLFAWTAMSFFKPIVIVEGKAKWYVGFPYEEDGLVYFRSLRSIGQKQFSIHRDLLRKNGMTYYSIGVLDDTSVPGHPEIIAFQTDKLEVTHLLQMKSQRDEQAYLLQKERRERKGEIMSSKGVALEFVRASSGGGRDQK